MRQRNSNPIEWRHISSAGDADGEVADWSRWGMWRSSKASIDAYGYEIRHQSTSSSYVILQHTSPDLTSGIWVWYPSLIYVFFGMLCLMWFLALVYGSDVALSLIWYQVSGIRIWYPVFNSCVWYPAYYSTCWSCSCILCLDLSVTRSIINRTAFDRQLSVTSRSPSLPSKPVWLS